jgi:hypothetical protein
MKLNKFSFSKAVAVLSFCFAGPAMAGPIIIAGTDADDHGHVSGAINQTGWAFMQRAFENISAGVTNGNKNVVCLGCNGATASAAFDSSASLSSLSGTWTFTSISGASNIENFFASGMASTGIIYMPTVASNVSGGIFDTELAVINLNGSTLNNFVTGGGGLFTQEQANSSIGYGWLTSLIPGFTVKGDNTGGIADASALQLTPAGAAAFPGLTNSDLVNATPWHAWFENYGNGLQVLAVGNGDGGFNDAVILGGGVSGVIACGQPGQLACPTNDVPEPASLPLLAAGFGLLAWRRRQGV